MTQWQEWQIRVAAVAVMSLVFFVFLWFRNRKPQKQYAFSERKGSSMWGKLLLIVVFFCPVIGLSTSYVLKSIDYSQNVGGYLKLAADANTVEMAKERLDKAIYAIEQRGWTQGTTRVLWEVPTLDVGLWYANLKSASAELGKVTPETDALERSNVLIKLRETLLDHGSEGDYVTVPNGIHLMPNNRGYVISWWASFLGAIVLSCYVSKTCRDIFSEVFTKS